MSKIRTEISIESSEAFVVRRKRYSTRTWCGKCGKTGIFVLPTEAGFLSGLDLDTIVSLVCAEEIHVHEILGRGTYVCLTSLCLLNTAPESHHSEELYESTKLSGGIEELGLSARDLRKL
ncbi:MAG: hypothetical protein OEM82_09205 [Acidobacteriota bacterium]|nr:hypothetical protein [Acidobacteriota bacterium]MDH3528050.1 hypothetical protein [Acidobacteriota bacterium]